MKELKRTRLSLFYLGGYLTVIGLALLFAPRPTLDLLQASGEYGDVFPRVAGMLMSGLGIAVVGMIRARTFALYPATLAIRAYFSVCLLSFYGMTGDPLFLVVTAIVLLGFALTLGGYLLDRGQPS